MLEEHLFPGCPSKTLQPDLPLRHLREGMAVIVEKKPGQLVRSHGTALAMNVKHKLIWVEDSASLQTVRLPPASEMNADYARNCELVPYAIELVHGVDVPLSEFSSGLDFYERDDAADLTSHLESLLKGTSDIEATAGKLFGCQ